MSVKIKLKHSSTAGKVPAAGDLDAGEVALNTSDVKAYIKNAGGAVVQLAGNGSVPDASETATGVVELATAAETTTGTDATRAVHPAGLKVELDKKVNKAGDTMTGALVLPAAAPTADAEAANKKYVDDQVAAGDFWSRTGTTLSPETAGDVVAFSAGADALPGLTPAGDPDTGIYSPGADQLALSTNGSERARIDSSGRLLVGTTTASTAGTSKLLQVVDSDGGAIGLGRTTSTSIGNGEFLGGLDFLGAGLTPSAHIWCHADAAQSSTSDLPSRLVFSTTPDGLSSPTERMRITQEGYVATYCDNPSGGYGLYVASAAAASSSSYLILGTNGATGTLAGTTSFVVATNGNVTNTNNSYGAISDAKLKENIVDAKSQWDDLKALQIRNYNFKEGQTHTQLGLIAQEAELVSPGLVSESPDRDAEGNDLGTVTKSVNYSVLYMKAVKALQEAMERIETLEAKVAALETP